MKATRHGRVASSAGCILAAVLAAILPAQPAGGDPVSAPASLGQPQPARMAHTAGTRPADEIITIGSAEPGSAQAPVRQFRLVSQGSKILPRHILKQFDFDERKYGNHEAIPMYWTQRKGPNLPHYNKGQFDPTVGHDGPPSFRLHTTTDSIAFSYTRNDIAVEPGNRYLVSAWIRTQNVQKNLAFLSAAYVSRDLSVLEGTEVFSDPIRAAEQNSPWHQVELPTRESPRGARFLQITVWLAQPEMHRQEDLRDIDRLIAEQDTNATAWFDDIEVTHLVPLPSIRAQADVPVFQSNQAVELTGPRVNPAHFGLACRITVTDESGQVYYENQTDPHNLGQAPPERITLERLPSGLYTGRLQVLSQDRQLTEQQVRFVKLPELAQVTAGQIGVCLNEATLQAPEASMACIRGLAASSVKIPIWTAGTTDAQIAQGRPGAEDLLKRVLAAGLEPIGMLVSPPENLAHRLLPAHGTLVDLFSTRQQDWQPYLALSLTHYADVMRLWQIGTDGQDELATDSRYAAAAEQAARQIISLIDGAQVSIAWLAQETFSGALPGIQRMSVSIPDAVRPEQIPQYVSLHGQDAKVVQVTLQPLQARRYSASIRRSDMARRIVFAMAGGAEMVFAPQPWEVVEAGDKMLVAPTTEYTVLATLSRALAGKHHAGQFTWTNGAVFHIFASADDATLVAWNDGPVAANTAGEPITLYLGQDVAGYDLCGRSIAIPGEELQTLRVGAEPIVITGADYRLAKLRSLFDVQPRQVASGLRAHQQTITLTNPYNEPINGMVRLRGPEGWEIAPSRLGFALAAGQSMEMKVEMRIPYNESIGPKTLTADLGIDSRRFHQLSIPVTLNLQLPGIDTYAFTDSTASEIIVRHVLTNRTSEELSFVGSVLLPQASRQERLFLHMRPGQTVVKEYIIPRGQLQGLSRLRLSLREINGPRLLNQMVDIL